MKATNYSQLKQFTKPQINGLTKKLNSFRFGQRRDPSKADQREEFMASVGLDWYGTDDSGGEVYFFSQPKKITREQTVLGINWLKNYLFKLNGDTRKRAENLSSEHISIARNVSRFEFVGVLGFRNSYGDLLEFRPIYRAFNRKGWSFDYSPGHWCEPIFMESRIIEPKNRARIRLNTEASTQPTLKVVK